MQIIKRYFQQILSFLRIRARAEGLEISDQVVRLVYFEKKEWAMAAVRVAPGAMEQGKIKDPQAFNAALRELKAKVPSVKGKKKKLNVVIALSSINVYSQVFTLPAMEGDDLEKAIGLNVQMVSPVDISHAYFGWELMGRDEASLRSEVAAAFVDKALVDDMVQALYSAGFITVGVESRALALVRTLREKGAAIDMEKSYLLLDIDNSGIDFLVVRKGRLYFEYPTLWADIADEKGQVPVEKFQMMLEASLRQVMNFYSQHWPEPLAGVILSATAFQEQAEKAIKEAASLPVVPLALVSEVKSTSEWFVAFGCALRGLRAGSKDEEINLSGDGTMDTFREEQVMNFLVLWRVLIPVVLGCLVVILALAANFLGATKVGIGSSGPLAEQGSESADIMALEASATAFNQSVTLIAAAEASENRNYLIVAALNAAAATSSVSISRISFQAPNAPILVSGTASSETQVAAFQAAIQSDPHFGTVTLSTLTAQGAGEGYSFSLSFPLASAF